MKKKTGRPRDQKRRAEILRLLEAGWHQGAIVRELKASHELVQSVRAEHPGRFAIARGGRPRDDERRAAIAELLRQGKSCLNVAREIGASESSVREIANENGGMLPVLKERSSLRLSLAEREEISRCLGMNWKLRCIARHLKRSPSTISREVKANGGKDRYRAWAAERRRDEQSKRPKQAKLVVHSKLKTEVESRLGKKHSPRQIALCLMDEFPDQPDMQISHEAIYQSLFIQGRGALRRELTACLRTGRAVRKRQTRERRAGKIKDMVMISDRPAEVDDRAIPGHWEGDLIVGKNGASAIATLVERNTRYVMLMKVKNKEAETIRDALTNAVQRLPKELFKSITWDQGTEMANHAQFTIDTDVQVYFCDPHSPWQRGSNENTNGLLRQYFPKGTVLSGYSQDELDAVARELNERPRETLGLKTPAFMLDQLLR